MHGLRVVVQDSPAHGLLDGGDAVVDVQLGVDIRDVRRDGAFRDGQPAGDGLVGQPLAHEPEDLLLARGQRLEHLGHIRFLVGLELAEHPRRKRGIEFALPLSDLFDRLDHLIQLRGLEQVSRSSGLQGVEYELLLVVTRKHQDTDIWKRVLDLSGGLDPVLGRHDDVDDHHVWNGALDRLQRLRSVRGFPDYLDVPLGLKHRLYALSEEIVIVDQNDTHRFGDAHSEMIDGSRPEWPRGRKFGIQVFVGRAESSLVSVKRVVFCAIALLVVASSAPAGAYPFSRILEEGDRGRDVLALEVRLAGWYPHANQQALLVNRRFGRRTTVAVEAFQRHFGLAVDGVAGRATYSILNSLQDKNGSTEHFNWSEFEQNHNPSCSSQANAYAGTFGGGMVAPRKVKGHVRRLMWRLEALRAKGGSHLIGINSAFRSVKYNQCIGGAGLSQHMYGTAADNRMANVRNRRERNIAKRSQLSGIGCYASLSHNHFDTRIDNRDLPSSRFWWWPKRDSKGRDLDATGRPCWGEGARKAGRSPAGGARRAGPQSLVPSVREVRAFQAAGEPADLLGAD